MVCREAAEQLAKREARPVPASVVLPLPAATQVVSLEGFPDDDAGRFDLLARFAGERMRPVDAPCWGFIAEAELGSPGDERVDVLVVAYGARGHHPRLVAAPLERDGLGEFSEPDDLEPTALPFLAPLQHAADAAEPPDVLPGLS